MVPVVVTGEFATEKIEGIVTPTLVTPVFARVILPVELVTEIPEPAVNERTPVFVTVAFPLVVETEMPFPAVAARMPEFEMVKLPLSEPPTVILIPPPAPTTRLFVSVPPSLENVRTGSLPSDLPSDAIVLVCRVPLLDTTIFVDELDDGIDESVRFENVGVAPVWIS